MEKEEKIPALEGTPLEGERLLVGQASPEQIEAWKRQHGKIFSVTVDDGVCYLKKPSRKALGYASFASKQDPLKFNEVILNDCWLGGDETIRTDDAKFLGISGVLADIIEVKEAELKNL